MLHLRTANRNESLLVRDPVSDRMTHVVTDPKWGWMMLEPVAESPDTIAVTMHLADWLGLLVAVRHWSPADIGPVRDLLPEEWFDDAYPVGDHLTDVFTADVPKHRVMRHVRRMEAEPGYRHSGRITIDDGPMGRPLW